CRSIGERAESHARRAAERARWGRLRGRGHSIVIVPILNDMICHKRSTRFTKGVINGELHLAVGGVIHVLPRIHGRERAVARCAPRWRPTRLLPARIAIIGARGGPIAIAGLRAIATPERRVIPPISRRRGPIMRYRDRRITDGIRGMEKSI